MTVLRSAAFATALLVASSVASAAVIVIDPMTLEFPTNPCFPVTNPRVLAYTSYCDAPSCPPGVPVPAPEPCNVTDQPITLPTLGATSRRAVVGGASSVNTARVIPGDARMECVTEGGEYSALYVAYGDYFGRTWSVDLPALGLQSIRTVVSGDITAEHPVYLEIMLLTDLGNDVSLLSNSWIQIDAPGTYDFPLSSFQGWPAGYPAADLHHIDLIDFLLSDCYDQNCVGTDFPARSYSLGPISMITDAATKTQRSTWAKLKQIYR
jgi:hypothetical protein